MGYVEDNLMSNEKILFTARVHPAVFLQSIVVFIFSIFLFIYGFSKAATISKAGSPAPVIDATTVLGSFILFFSVGVFLYAIFLGLQAAVAMFATEFAVTNRRVIAKTGFVRRNTLEMLLPKIESVSVNQSVLGRMLNFGSVTVTGTGGTQESFNAIIEPIGVRKKINRIIEKYMQYQQKLSNQRAGG